MKKKIIAATVLCTMSLTLITGCAKSTESTSKENENTTISAEASNEEVSAVSVEASNEDVSTESSTDISSENQDVVYMGGLYARDENNDMMLALFRSSGTPVVLITEGEDLYYGELITEEAVGADGEEYVSLTLEGKTFGYHFNDDMTGFLIDENGNKYYSLELDESVAMDMLGMVN